MSNKYFQPEILQFYWILNKCFKILNQRNIKNKIWNLRKLVYLPDSITYFSLFVLLYPVRIPDMQQREKYMPSLIKKLMNLFSLLIMTGQCLSQMEESWWLFNGSY